MTTPRRLLSLTRPFLQPLLWSALARTLQLSAGIALFALAGWSVGQGFVGELAWAVVVWIMVGLCLAKGLLRYAEQFCGHLVAFRALAWLRVYFYNRLEPQAPAAVESRATGDLLSRVTKDVDRVEVFFAHTLVPAVTAVIVPMCTVIAYACLVDPLGAVILAIGLLVAGLGVPLLGSGSSAQAAAEVRRARGAIAQHVTDSIQGVREVLAFDYQDRRDAEQRALETPVGAGMGVLGTWTALRRGLNLGVVLLTLVAEFVLQAHTPVTDSRLPILVLGLAMTLAAFSPVLAVEDFSADLQQAFASAERLFEVVDAAPLVEDTGTRVPPSERLAPEMSLEDVSFTYPNADGEPSRLTPQVSHVSIDIAAGQTTAIVGASGSGKSTLAALLVRSWDPDQGRITLDGRDLRDYPLGVVRTLVGISPQRPYVFNDTIETNLRLGRPDATDEEVERAIRLAVLDEVVDAEPTGLETMVGDMGERLSGGQRQRLALARTLLTDPAVLVLDEATSQLDEVTQAKVLERVREARIGRTTVVIAHRLSIVEYADWIIVLDAGQVVQQGTYEHMATQPGPFLDLLERQS